MRSVRFFIIFFLFYVTSVSAQTQELIRIDQAQSGMLLIETKSPDRFLPIAAVHTETDIKVTGLTARATVRQSFLNSSTLCVEGLYVFPLPENAAVDHLVLIVGDRRIEGEIKPRATAKQVYDTARREGRKAALVEQHRANIFQVSVASILPGEKIDVEIAYQQEVQYDSGEFRLRYPMTIAPRYSPAADATKVSVSSDVPIRLGGSSKVDLTIHLDAGMPLAEVRGSYHPVDIEQLSETLVVARLAEGAITADRDFELVWRPRLGSEPQSAWFVDSATAGSAESDYSMVMLMPPGIASPSPLPRDVTFVIDRSGSMSGVSMDQAKKSLELALERLRPIDSFNVIEFDDRNSKLFERPVVASPDRVAEAVRFVRALSADGGTEILGALQLALAQLDRPTDAVRQMVFITDGQVSNEAAVFDFLQRNLGDTRLFTVGIGSAPNSLFMSGAARLGRGTFTYIGDSNEVNQKMQLLFTKLESPALTDLVLEFDDPAVEVYPAKIPDLYAGEPLVVLVRSNRRLESLRIRGRSQEKVWIASASRSAIENSGIEKLWARRKIDSLTDSMAKAPDVTAVEREITDVALSHRLVSNYTSLVAVDVTPASLGKGACVSVPIPLGAPHGADLWNGNLPRTATSWRMMLLLSLLLAAGALVSARRVS